MRTTASYSSVPISTDVPSDEELLAREADEGYGVGIHAIADAHGVVVGFARWYPTENRWRCGVALNLLRHLRGTLAKCERHMLKRAAMRDGGGA